MLVFEEGGEECGELLERRAEVHSDIDWRVTYNLQMLLIK